MMFRKIVRGLVAKRQGVRFADAWNSLRHECVTYDDKKQHRHQTETVEEAPVGEISWIAMICYVEGIDPGTIALSEEMLQVVRREMERVRAMKPLEGYAWCLERLQNADEESSGAAEVSCVDDQK